MALVGSSQKARTTGPDLARMQNKTFKICVANELGCHVECGPSLVAFTVEDSAGAFFSSYHPRLLCTRRTARSS